MNIKTLNDLTEEQKNLRAILIDYSHSEDGSNEQQEIIKKCALAVEKTDEYNLDIYKEIVNQPGYNKTYKTLYDKLVDAVTKFRKKNKMLYMRQFEDQKKAESLIKSTYCYETAQYDKFSNYGHKKLDELNEKVVYYLNSDKVADVTKDTLRSIKDGIDKLFANYDGISNEPMEIEFKALIAAYANGEKEKVFKEILENEKKYYDNLFLALEEKISFITRNELKELLSEYVSYKKDLQRKIALNALCYLYETDSKIDGQFFNEYMEIYKAYLSNRLFLNLDGINDEQKKTVETFITAIDEYKTEQNMIARRGYDAESLTCVNNLLNKYKDSKPIAYASVNQLAFGKKRIPTWNISTYIIKFRNDKKLSEEDYELYKKFAKKYGYPMLSWIILECNINNTEDDNSIKLEEIIRFCDNKHRTENKPVLAEIKKVIRNVLEDKSLTDDEKQEILRKVEVFKSKYKEAKTESVLNSYGLYFNSFDQLIKNISNPEYIVSCNDEQNKSTLSLLKKIYEITKREDIKSKYDEVKEAIRKKEKESNEKHRAEVYVSIKANFKKIADLIISGIEYADGKKRPFDLIDYHMITTLSFEQIEGIGITDLDSKQRTAWNKFKTKHEYSLDFIGEKRLQEIMNTRSIVNQTIKNGKVVPGTGRELTKEEKTAILNYLKSKKVPYTLSNYYAAKRRYLKGYIEEELLGKTESTNEQSIEKTIEKK